MENDKVRENKYRKLAKRLGYVLRKSRAKQWSIDNQLGYMLLDAHYSVPVIQSATFDLDLDDVADFLKAEEEDL